MRIGFDFVCDEAPLFSGIGKLFERDGCRVFGFTMGRRWDKWWHNQFSAYKLDAPNEAREDIGGELERIQEQYGSHAPASFLTADRFLDKKPRDFQRSVLVSTFEAVESAFEKEEPHYYISTGVAFLYNLVTLAVCAQRDIPHISIYSTRAQKPRFTISLGNGGCWDLVDQEYRLLQVTEQYESFEYESGRAYLDSFRERPSNPFYMASARQSHSIKSVFIKEFIGRMKYWYIDGWRKERGDYITQPPWWYAMRDMKKLVRARSMAIKAGKIFDKPKDNSAYYLFPLHLQPEASTLVLSEWYVDQLQTIRNISKTLPLDTVLYVKEHMSAFGRHSIEFYNAIKAIHNVSLIGPGASTPQLIKESLGVIVLSSTVGWEAALLNRQVFVLGQVFYRSLIGVESIGSFDDLRTKLLAYRRDEGRSSPKNNDDNIIKFLIALQRQSFDGVFDVAKMDMRNVVTADENIEKLHAGLKGFIDRISSPEKYTVCS